MPVRVSKRARAAPPIRTLEIRAIAERMLEALGIADAELSVLLADDATLHELNRTHLGKDRPTDVLAFPLDEREAAQAHARHSGGAGILLGDVVISLHSAARQARSRRRSTFDEVRFLLAHGLLHLTGYDHAKPKEKARMAAMTRRLVRAAQAASPRRAGVGRSGEKRPRRAALR